MRDVSRATRASLASLAGGASLKDALRAAASVCQAPEIGARYAAAADDLGSDSFRAEVIGKLAFSPAVVGLLLARSPKSALAQVAESSIQALPRRTRDIRGKMTRAYVVLLAIMAGAAGAALDLGVRQMANAPVSNLIYVLAGLAFALAVLSQAWATIGEGSTGQSQLLYWFVAAERAGVPPGAVLEPIIAGAPLSARPLEALRRDLRGVDTIRDAITVWAESSGLRGPAARLAGLVPEGDDAVGAAERMARIAALDRPIVGARLLLYAAYVMAGGAVITLGRELFALLAAATP